jgi:hypothetical protein
MEHTWGYGRVVQFSSSANASWNDLPVRPVYVPFVHRVLGSLLARQDERLNLQVGAQLTYVMDQDLIGKDVTISKPGGGKDISGVRRVTVNNGIPLLQYEDTDLAGAYEVKIGSSGGAPLLRFAAQTDPAESKLAELSGADLKSFDGIADIIHWTSGAAMHATIQHGRTGTEFWLAFAIVGLCCAVAETALGNHWSRSR